MRTQMWKLAAATAGMAVAGTAASFFPHRLLSAMLPAGLVLWLLLILDTGYLIGRNHRHRQRRRASQEERDEQRPGPETRRPVEFPGVLEPDPELRRALGDPVTRQGRLRGKGLRLAAMPVISVVMVSAPTAFLPRGGAVAAGFAAAGCLSLLAMLMMIWSDRQPAHAWVTGRLRRELFRREMYLLLAGTGPYLGACVQEAERIRDARLNLLARAYPAGLHQFATLSDQDSRAVERHWIDLAWCSGPGAADPDLAERMRTYLEYRIRRQVLFFKLGMEKSERTERNFGTAAKVAVLAGIAVSIIHCTRLATVHRPDSAVTAVLALSAAGLPALCNGVIALQNLFASQRLAVSYQETRDELVRHENNLRKILAQPSAPDAGTRFRALAIHVEDTLTRELFRWKVLVDRSEFDPAL